jgi:hypothetical protein
LEGRTFTSIIGQPKALVLKGAGSFKFKIKSRKNNPSKLKEKKDHTPTEKSSLFLCPSSTPLFQPPTSTFSSAQCLIPPRPHPQPQRKRRNPNPAAAEVVVLQRVTPRKLSSVKRNRKLNKRHK